MFSASVTRLDEAWKVSCRDDSELIHALYFYDCDFLDSFAAFDSALRSAEIYMDFGVAVPFVV
ncbi:MULTISPECIES: hypothetical protein [Neisseria]|uniref:Uncharacterized protein n=1 Tax=Neisseria brasiliensis TaxID=2666100 RepID=A0A7X2H274_9NEIS|nr:MULTISPECIES: hypothetical protein [Neisseria]MRN39297.1 hypothetical protein [Neisseria brasiliensis]